MKAIKIDATNQTVTEIEIDGSLDDIYKHVECRCFAIGAYFENEDAVYVDDEGLLVGKEAFFELEGITSYPLAGNSLIVGTDMNTGKSIDCQTTLEEVKQKVSFLTYSQFRKLAAWGLLD